MQFVTIITWHGGPQSNSSVDENTRGQIYSSVYIFFQSFIQRITFNKNIEIKELVSFKIRYRVFKLLK